MIARGRKYLKVGPYGAIAGCVIVVAIGIRVILIGLGWPGTNSDEATMGLMARHIAYLGEHPVYIYGQDYMGSLEAHIGAALFFIFGSSLFSLRLGLVLLYALFLVSLYLLTSLLYSKTLALAVVILFSIGSVELLTRQLKAVGGAMETMLFGSLLILLSARLVLTYRKDVQNAGNRWLLYGCFGLTMGLGMWSHLLILPFVATSLVFLVFFCYREVLRLPAFTSFSLGLLLGYLPSLIFNIQNPSQNSLRALLMLHNSGGTASGIPFTLWDQIRGTILISLPIATGASPQCLVPDTPGVWRTHITSCMLVQGVWGVGFLLLYSIVFLLLIGALVKYVIRWRVTLPSDEERHAMLLDAARLTLLFSGGLTLLSYVLSPAPALVPITSTRYLVGLLVMLPVLLAPLWNSVHQSLLQHWSVGAAIHCTQSWGWKRGNALATILFPNVNPSRPSFGCNELPPLPLLSFSVVKISTFLFIYLMYFTAIIVVFQQVPTVQASNQQQDKMIADLVHRHATHIYSDYWTCNRLIFQSNEQVICSVLDEQLRTGGDRYLPYQAIVKPDTQAVYVFRTGSPQALILAQRSRQTRVFYEYLQIDNYVLYKLKHPI